MTARSVDIGASSAKRPQPSRRSSIIVPVIVLLTVLIITIAGLGLGIYTRISGSEPGIGTIGIELVGREARVIVGLTVPGHVEIKGTDLAIEGPGGEYPLLHEGDELECVMGAYELGDLIEAGEGNVSGSVDVRVSPLPFDIHRDVQRIVDLSALKRLNATATIDNVSLGFGPIGWIRIDIEFTARLDMDIWITARNTTGTFITDFGSFEGRILSLDLDREGNGRSSVHIPYLAVLPLTLGRDDITVDLWGIPIDFDYPVSG